MLSSYYYKVTNTVVITYLSLKLLVVLENDIQLLEFEEILNITQIAWPRKKQGTLMLENVFLFFLHFFLLLLLLQLRLQQITIVTTSLDGHHTEYESHKSPDHFVLPSFIQRHSVVINKIQILFLIQKSVSDSFVFCNLNTKH